MGSFKDRRTVNHHVRGPEASEVAAVMSTGMRTFFQSGVQKNLKSLYQSFVPQKFASTHVCASRYNKENKFLVRSIQTTVSKERRKDQHRYPGTEPLSSTLNTLTRAQHRALRK